MRDLYPGAHVRLTTGEPATVIDAGEYLRGDVAVAVSGPRERPKGVLIELATGERRDVERSELLVVPPDHPCRGEPDPTEFERVKAQLEPVTWSWTNIVREFVPSTYEAAALVLHPWHSAHELVRWSEVARATGTENLRDLQTERFSIGDFSMRSEGQPDPFTMRTLIHVLGQHTATSDDVFFAVWEGWGGDRWDWFPDAAHVFVPHRGCWLLRGPIDGALAPVNEPGFRDTLRPLLWWPADGAWTAHADVDWRWTLVAGTEALIKAIEADPNLEVLRKNFDDAPAPG